MARSYSHIQQYEREILELKGKGLHDHELFTSNSPPQQLITCPHQVSFISDTPDF